MDVFATDLTHNAERTNPPRSTLVGRRVVVLGAGMVGVSAALELQARGAEVTVFDRRSPGRETSWGNAGVIARSSLIPLNNPTLWRSLPGLIGNRRAALRYDPAFVLRNPRWVLGFLANARASAFTQTTEALDSLIRLSANSHRRLMSDCGTAHRVSENGWLLLYRNAAAFERSAPIRAEMARFGVDIEILSQAGLIDLEPALKPVFDRAMWVRDSQSVDDPGAVVTAYANRFVERGGLIERAEIAWIETTQGGVTLHGSHGTPHDADLAVVSLGPWARDFLEAQGFHVPMAYERGYHRHFGGTGDGAQNSGLRRPVHDIAGGFVLSPMKQGLRLSTGVEICARDAPRNERQLAQAEAAARQVIDLGNAVEEDCWLGSRPTFPDSRPVIGALPGMANVWACFGHQHIGFSTGPGSAHLLADLMERRIPSIPAEPFRPERFIRRR
ncbi:MAG: FAD-dependent oxidoreductase [Pseudomonadota bacterium]